MVSKGNRKGGLEQKGRRAGCFAIRPQIGRMVMATAVCRSGLGRRFGTGLATQEVSRGWFQLEGVEHIPRSSKRSLQGGVGGNGAMGALRHSGMLEAHFSHPPNGAKHRWRC